MPRPQDRPKAAAVIINYKGREHLEELFDSLARQTLGDFEVLFIDNNSGDGSIALVDSLGLDWVRTVANDDNLGYAKAANQGVRLSRAEHVIFLNTDIRLAPDCLEELVAVADSDPEIAAAAAKMRLHDRPDYINGIGGGMNYLGYTWDRGMFEKDEGQYDQVEDVIFACGGAALFRRSSFNYAGGYDERFFMYHEDVDLCWRLWILGFRVVTAPQAVVYHRFSGTTRETKGMNWREVIGERNSICAMLKNYELENLFPALHDLKDLPQKPRRKEAQNDALRWNLKKLPGTLLRRLWIQARRRRPDREINRLMHPGRRVPVDISEYMERQAPKEEVK